MAERTTAESRLERLLYILPAASREEGATLDELANALGIAPSEVMRDLEEATARAYYHPAGSVESFQILVEGGRVRVWSPSEFRRPVRLTPREALALGLGLRTLAAEAEEPRRSAILALAARLETDLAPPAPGEAAVAGSDEAVAPYQVELGDDGFRGAVAEAAQLRRRCRIVYLKPGDDAPRERLIEPYALVYAGAGWYTLGRDVDRDAVRVFRMDRILDAELTDECFELSADFDAEAHLGAGGVPYKPEGASQALVRYSPRVARWVAEAVDRSLQPDGALVVRHDVADPRWLVRHVLQYAGEAELLEPQEMREHVARAARRVAERAA